MEFYLINSVIVVGLLFLSALFSASESALFSLSPIQIESFSKDSFLYKKIKKILGNTPRLLITILLGNETVNVCISSLVAAMLFESQVANEVWLPLVSMGVSIPLLLLFGEIPPKMFAIKRNVLVSTWVTPMIYSLFIILKPLSVFIVKINHFFFSLITGEKYKERKMTLSEQEILHIIHLYEEDGVIDEFEKSVIQKILSFSDVPVLKIMIPIKKVVSISTTTSLEQIIQIFKKHDFLRVPVVDPKQGNRIIGVFHSKEILRLKLQLAHRKNQDIDWLNHISQPLKMNYHISLEQLFNRFRRQRNHFAIIFDDHQKPIGVITLDDILRHLFGKTAEIGE